MGVINVTPDSFSDGGHFLDPSACLNQAQKLVEEGADIIDFGAESSRPGADPVSPDIEWQRLQPALAGMKNWPNRPLISVDTRHPQTMLKAAENGADIINDIEGARQILPVHGTLAKEFDVSYLAMHMQGSPKSMQKDPLVGREAAVTVQRFFGETHAKLLGVGFTPNRIWLDPGFGFGKTDSGNAWLAAFTGEFAASYNLCVGVSRKSFLGRTLAIPNPEDRDPASKMFEFGLALMGAKMIRTHAVAALRGLLNCLN